MIHTIFADVSILTGDKDFYFVSAATAERTVKDLLFGHGQDWVGGEILAGVKLQKQIKSHYDSGFFANPASYRAERGDYVL